jgi:signal transduction histidine kinase
VSGFTLPAPPLVALTALCASTYLLIPLNAPAVIRDGFAGVPPEAQVRSGWLPTAVPLAGIAALLAATAAVADSRPWAVPFGFGVLAVLAVLAAVRQVATLRETRRLYREVEVAAGERRRLLTELLERQVDDRRSVAVHLHQQAMSAYASFTTLTTAERAPGTVAQVSALVGDDLRRRAEDLHDLVQSMRSRSGAGTPGTAGLSGPSGAPGPPAGGGAALVAPVRAFLTTLYGDRTPPRLTVTVADGLELDWVVETVLLQVAHEALRNVRDHSGAARVDVDVFAVDGVAVLEVADDGRGFEVGATPEGDGVAVMRAAVGVIDGSLTVDAAHGRGTAVVARLGPAPGWGPGGGGRPVLRSVPRLRDPAG